MKLLQTHSGGSREKMVKKAEEKQLLTLMEKAFTKANNANMDTNQMINWLKQELQTQYTQKPKAL
jgi:hypothetical protein